MRTGVVDQIQDLAENQWNRLAKTAGPFLSHEFLAALERHGCVGETFGWYPQHIVVYDDNDCLVGAMPLYIKDNSYGEFVFDWSWADAYQRAGMRYYPKLVSSIPYTPVTGPRLLVRDGADRAMIADALVSRALEHTGQSGCSSLHCLFCDTQDTEVLLQHGLLRRTGCHFHWQNSDYQSFDDFLSHLSSRKRKKIRRERRFVEEADVSMEIIHGNEATEAQWQLMHTFYRTTFERKSGIPTLSLDFFLDLTQRIGDRIVLVFARHGGRAVAGAINLRSEHALYGRHWGCLQDFHSLHFETCYYQGIDYCIQNRLELFEPGAQGEHKISRGFLPTLTWSAHWIQDPAFRTAISRYLASEHELMLDYWRDMGRHSPYRQGNAGSQGQIGEDSEGTDHER